MKIEITEFVEGAREAKGLVVIIDVFRAFSVACYGFDAGASRYIATNDPREAFNLKERYKGAVLVGEREEKKIAGFDLGNSPTEILKADLDGKTIVHTTTAGTNGLINASKADLIITGSLVNAGAVADYIKLKNPDLVTLVAMGFRARESADEDLICAELIADRLNGLNTDFSKRVSDLRSGAGLRFFNPENIVYSPPTDFFLCTMIDRFNFIVRAEKRNDGNMDLMKIDM